MKSSTSRMAQYWALTKPRVTQLAVFCAVIGMFLATDGMPDWRVVIAAMKPTASSDEWMSNVIMRQRKAAVSPARVASCSETINVRPSLSRNTI